jgi:hypothetical protein
VNTAPCRNRAWRRAGMTQRAVVGAPVFLDGALDKVWDFVRTHEGFRTDGHNVFIYRQKDSDNADGKLTIDFGVQITRSFAGEGDVICSRRRRVASPPRCM